MPLAATAGLTLGAVAGMAAVALAAGGANVTPTAAPPLDAAHLPPLLTLAGEPVTLRYAIVCGVALDAPPGPCNGSGTVYIRRGQKGDFRPLQLTRDDDSIDGRWFVHLPPDIARSPSGFSYYAVLRDEATGSTLTLPPGGAAAPQRSLPLGHAVVVDLGGHAFDATRAADARVVSATWGDGPGQVGLSGGLGTSREGPGSFDVGPDGTITVLDQANGRIQRWRDGVAEEIPVAVSKTLADLAVGPEGTIYVLDEAAEPGHGATLRSFRPDGTPAGSVELAERTWSKLEMGPDGPIVQQQPAEQWMPVATGATRLRRPAQIRAARSGRALADGSELVVLRVGTGEVRIARVAGGSVRQAWRISSETPLGEVQLAQPIGNRLAVVFKTYTESRDEFEVLVLDGRGIVRRFAVEAAGWAETAPLSRFRLAGSSLYQLGTTPTEAFVDRFDLEVTR
jgi:hypothetical protein